jgi:hypothetical protein
MEAARAGQGEPPRAISSPRTPPRASGRAAHAARLRAPFSAEELPMSAVAAYSISAAAVVAEKARVGGDPAKVDVSRVIALDTLELRPLGPTDVHLRILAV